MTRQAKGGAPDFLRAHALGVSGIVVIGIVGLVAVVLLARALHNRQHGRSGGDNGPGGSAAQVPSKVQRLWCVSPRLLRFACALDDLRSGRGLRRRGAWIKLLASLSLCPARTAVVAVVGDDRAAARCLQFCTLPGGAMVARRGGIVYAAVRLSGSVHVADVERWVRRRLARAVPTAGIGSAETSWNGESVLSTLGAAKSAAMVDAIRALEQAAQPKAASKPRRRRPRAIRPVIEEVMVTSAVAS